MSHMEQAGGSASESKKNPREQLLALRQKHGFKRIGAGTRASAWSKGTVALIIEGHITEEGLAALRGRLAEVDIDHTHKEFEEKITRIEQIRETLDPELLEFVEEMFVSPDEFRPEPFLHAVDSSKRTGYIPRNWVALRLMERRFPGFVWGINPHQSRGGSWTYNLVFENGYPTIGGVSVTLMDCLLADIGLFDPNCVQEGNGDPSLGKLVDGFDEIRGRMEATGVGYKGLNGVSWMPMADVFVLPTDVERQLELIGRGIFALNDAVTAVLPIDPDLQALLNHKRPDYIPALVGKSRVGLTRPDICLMEHPDRPGRLIAVCTEVESAPAGQGMADAMLQGYGLNASVAAATVKMLAGRELLIVMTREWSEYVFDQAVWAKMVCDAGGRARILFDAPLSRIAEIAAGWESPVPGIAWNTDILGRLMLSGLIEFVSGCDALPDSVGGSDTVLWRFGYFDQFRDGGVEAMLRWEAEGTEVLNGLGFFAESKVLMAAVDNPTVRAWIRANRSEEVLKVLDTHVATTRLLAHANGQGHMTREQLTEDRLHWLVKYAGYDGGNMSWGSRSLQVGAQMTDGSWGDVLRQYAAASHPVVAQHLIRGKYFDVDHVDAQGLRRRMTGARTRLTPMLFRDGEAGCKVAGSIITLRPGTFRIHGATDAVEGPVVFKD